jgi:hypothetical protein
MPWQLIERACIVSITTWVAACCRLVVPCAGFVHFSYVASVILMSRTLFMHHCVVLYCGVHSQPELPVGSM